MRDFELGILTPVGEFFSGNVQALTVRTSSGEVRILAGHTDYLAGVVPCVASFVDEEGRARSAFCGGGFLSVVAGMATLTVDEFAFAESIDAAAADEGRNQLAAELAACDPKAEPERAQYLKDAVARAEAKRKVANAR